eukprot:COSAG01_NODE_90_length_27307_cov_734.166458_28_plen_69_part_00
MAAAGHLPAAGPTPRPARSRRGDPRCCPKTPLRCGALPPVLAHCTGTAAAHADPSATCSRCRAPGCCS